MSSALWRVDIEGRDVWARGDVQAGPQELLATGIDADTLLGSTGPDLADLGDLPAVGPVPSGARVLAPLGRQTVWAAGVTYRQSHEGRRAESTTPDHYDRVYVADRPELFLKAVPGAAHGPGDPVCIRSDSTWDVPEPELGLVVNHAGRIVGCTIGNDMSSRSIEGENPLYLPQAKVYTGSCSIGPALVALDRDTDIASMVIAMTITRDARPAYSDDLRVDQMKREPADLVSWLMRGQQFPHGVLLLTGTALVPPPEFTLVPGDMVSISITGLGTLVNHVERIEVT